MWLTVGMLFLGTFLVFGIWVISGGIALVGVSSYVLDAGLLNQWLAVLIESVADLRFVFNFGAVFLKIAYIIMNQPLFWGGVISVISSIGFWVWMMRVLSRRSPSSIQMVI